MLREIILTEYLDPNETTYTGYHAEGPPEQLTELEWCCRVVEGLVKRGRNAEVAFDDKTGMVAVREWIAPGKWDNFVVNSEDESEG